MDGLRAIAVIWVILCHVSGEFLSNRQHLPDIEQVIDFWFLWFLRGQHAIQIFFALSGYLIARILLNAMNCDERNGREKIRVFIRKRCFRIIPALYTFSLISTLLPAPLCRPWTKWRWLELIFVGNLAPLFGLNDAHTWTISVEMQMYCISPWLIQASRRTLSYVSIVVLLFKFALLPLLSISDPWWRIFNQYTLVSQLPAYLAGIWAAMPFAMCEDKVFTNHFFDTAAIMTICLFFLLPSRSTGWCDSLLGISVAWSIHAMHSKRMQWLKELLSGRGWTAIARLSYSLYLWQFVSIFAVEGFLKYVLFPAGASPTYIFFALATFSLSLNGCLSYASWALIEHPCILAASAPLPSIKQAAAQLGTMCQRCRGTRQTLL